MATSKTHQGKTPNGGVRSSINFRDSQGDPADESVATAAEIIEYDKDGIEIGRTYGTIGRKREASASPKERQ